MLLNILFLCFQYLLYTSNKVNIFLIKMPFYANKVFVSSIKYVIKLEWDLMRT